MRTFNPEKELRKIQRGNKNKIIIGVIALLLIIAIGSSYALYQIRYNKQIIYTTVDNFYQNDVSLSVYIDGEKKTDPNSFPEQNSGKIFSHITCENGGTGYFDNTKWELNLKTTEQDRCNVYFVTGNLPNEPELYQGMIPVTFSDTGIMYVADTNKDWYNYQDHRWANAVLVNAGDTATKAKYFDGNSLRDNIVGKEVPMEEVLQMYVWIPRYKYKLFNVGEKTSAPKQIIEIAFEEREESTGDVTCSYDITAGTVTENCPGIAKDKWYTHPAFKFGDTELEGFWVGKFEPSAPDDANGRKSTIGDTITILPNKTSMVLKTVSTMFYAERDMEEKHADTYNINSEQIDTHMMKNSEWGAVAYLTQSKYGIYTNDEEGCVIEGMDKTNCEVWINNTSQGQGTSNVTYPYGGTATGCVGSIVSADVEWNAGTPGSPATCPEGRRWNESGVNASTTGNMYGIYDMSGGAYEYVMGVILQDGKTDAHLGSSGFTTTESATKLPDSKYYDLYTTNVNANTQERGHYGDATKEIMQEYSNLEGAWNSGYAFFPYVSTYPWFARGGKYDDDTRAGVFTFGRWHGDTYLSNSFRSVLSHA